MNKIYSFIIIILTSTSLYSEKVHGTKIKTKQKQTRRKINELQQDIETLKKYLKKQLQLPRDQRDLSKVQPMMESIYDRLFTHEQSFLQLRQEFRPYQHEIVEMLGDLTYSWYVVDKIDEVSMNLDSSFDTKLSFHPDALSARQWARLTQQAGFDKPGQLQPEITAHTMDLMKPNSTFAAINKALPYVNYALEKAIETTWFYFPEQAFGVPQDWVNQAYYLDHDKVRADMAATYHSYIEPAAHRLLDLSSQLQTHLSRRVKTWFRPEVPEAKMSPPMPEHRPLPTESHLIEAK